MRMFFLIVAVLFSGYSNCLAGSGDQNDLQTFFKASDADFDLVADSIVKNTIITYDRNFDREHPSPERIQAVKLVALQIYRGLARHADAQARIRGELIDEDLKDLFLNLREMDDSENVARVVAAAYMHEFTYSLDALAENKHHPLAATYVKRAKEISQFFDRLSTMSRQSKNHVAAVIAFLIIDHFTCVAGIGVGVVKHYPWMFIAGFATFLGAMKHIATGPNSYKMDVSGSGLFSSQFWPKQVAWFKRSFDQWTDLANQNQIKIPDVFKKVNCQISLSGVSQ